MSSTSRSPLLELTPAALFVVGFCFGVWGFWLKASSSLDASARFLDALHATLQLVVLNVSADESHGWRLMWARVLLPVSASWVLLSFLFDRLTQWWMRLWLRVPRLKPLVLVLGCGRSGLQLARYYASGGMRVVGVDREVDAESARRFAACGFPVLELDFMNPREVPALPLRAARRIVICSGDDLLDLVACRLLHAATRGLLRPPTLMPTLEHPGIKRALEFDPLFGDRRVIVPIDLPLRSARLMFRDAAPHLLRPGRFVAGGENPCHVLLVAGHRYREVFAIQAVRALVYSTSSPLHLTVVTDGAASFEQELRHRYPALCGEPSEAVYGGHAPLARLRLVESSTTRIDVAALRQVHRTDPVDVIYVIGSDDAESAVMTSEAIKAADVLEPPPPIVAAFSGCVRVETDAGGVETPGRLRGKYHQPTPPDYVFSLRGLDVPEVRVFPRDGALSAKPPAGPEETPDDDNDDEARRVHGVHPAGVPWEALSEQERWWNRHAADHARLKLALIGSGPREDHLPWLARLEHSRYVTERLLDGWIRRLPAGAAADDLAAEGRQKVNRYLLNPTLQPYDALKPDESSKDIAIAFVLTVMDSVDQAERERRA